MLCAEVGEHGALTSPRTWVCFSQAQGPGASSCPLNKTHGPEGEAYVLFGGQN